MRALVCVVCVVALAAALGTAPAASAGSVGAGTALADGLPVTFVPNAGQVADGRVRYLAEGAGYSFLFADRGVRLVLSTPDDRRSGGRAVTLDLRFERASPRARLE